MPPAARAPARALLLSSLLYGCVPASNVDLTFTREGHADRDTSPSGTPAGEHDASAQPAESAPDASASLDAAALDVPPDPMGCYLYVMALCQRMAECRNLPVVSDGCLQSAAGCLDLATGRAPTNRGLRECAAAYADFSCELMLRGRRLECVSNGERSPGEPCSLALNCESLVCDYRAITEQYVCAELAGPGEECSAHVACTLGNTCTDGRCEPTPAPDFDNGNLPLGAAGADCRDPHQCQQGLFCRFDRDAQLGRCAAAPGAGHACGLTRGYDWAAPLPAACDEASYCVDGTCAPLPAAGQTCVRASFVDQPPCAPGTFCDETSGTCRPWKALGEACTVSTQRSGLSGLPLDPECAPEGEVRCACDDGTEDCAVQEQRCRVRVPPGGECGSEHAACLYGTRCVAGRCDYPTTAD